MSSFVPSLDHAMGSRPGAAQPGPSVRACRIDRPDPVGTPVGDPSADLAEGALDGRGRLGGGSRRARVHLRGGLRRTCFRRGTASGHQHRHCHRHCYRDPSGVRAPRTHPLHGAVLKIVHLDSSPLSPRLRGDGEGGRESGWKFVASVVSDLAGPTRSPSMAPRQPARSVKRRAIHDMGFTRRDSSSRPPRAEGRGTNGRTSPRP
jgi:hypothetical protein